MSRGDSPALVVGLTGGIASGKSTVAELFAARGVPVVDADRLAREVVAPGRPALASIVEAFGPGVLAPDGSLDRAALRERVFRDPADRRRLESILHPEIRTEMRRRLAALDAPYAILVIPLLLETGQRDMVDRILVVEAPERVRIERARARDGSPLDTLERIVASQASPAERRGAADDVLENDGPPEALPARVEHLHRRYLALAGAVASAGG